MDGEAARTLAAQVVNFLMGEDIDASIIARVSDEPLRARIMAVLPQVRQRAAEYMQADRQTREIVVATLRMTVCPEFRGSTEKRGSQSPAKMRIERLLVEYGPEFPEEISPASIYTVVRQISCGQAHGVGGEVKLKIYEDRATGQSRSPNTASRELSSSFPC